MGHLDYTAERRRRNHVSRESDEGACHSRGSSSPTSTRITEQLVHLEARRRVPHWHSPAMTTTSPLCGVTKWQSTESKLIACRPKSHLRTS
ncbi:hypothetical protein BCV70DRAFT_64816 [Testicularia cyperi]|uniref:Uncharacterized protein n=1 Tax=Testicularia cyperi TaxID=1882483 RepID=A0A317XGP8_9BASI|nr:hypothetical protein BCV70DRAFT_64816 [Testicularia cyperi]